MGIALLFEAAAIAAGAYLYGWRGALFALACVAAGHGAGHALALGALTRAGYVVEYRADGRGVRRWRVGVRAAATKPMPEPVTWFAPPAANQ